MICECVWVLPGVSFLVPLWCEGPTKAGTWVTAFTVLWFPLEGNNCSALGCSSTAHWYQLLILTVLKHPWICHFRKDFCWYKLIQLCWLKISVETWSLQLLNNCIFTHWGIQLSRTLKNLKGVKSSVLILDQPSEQWSLPVLISGN